MIKTLYTQYNTEEVVYEGFTEPTELEGYHIKSEEIKLHYLVCDAESRLVIKILPEEIPLNPSEIGAWSLKFVPGDELTEVIYIGDLDEEGVVDSYSTVTAAPSHKILLSRYQEHDKILQSNIKATRKLLRVDELLEEELLEMVYIYPEWKPGLPVKGGDLYRYNDKLYELIEGQDHTTQSDWTPDITPALWKSKTPEGVIPEFVQPTGAHDGYMTGDQVLFNGEVYISTIDNNTWSPTDYPQGWQLV